MSENLRVVDFNRRACDNLASDLRAMADAVDRGEIVDLVAAWVEDDRYQMIHSTSMNTALVLSTLLHRQAVDKFLTP